MAVLKLVAMAVLICVHVHHSAAVSFSYSSFSSVDFREEDDARITAAGRIELLGDESGGRARGRVVYKKPVQLWDGVTGEATNFTATFNVNITSLPGRSSSAVGHGMAFFLAPYMPDLPQESYDGCLGLFDESLIQPAQQNGTTAPVPSANATGGARFVAVELDTHRDAWDPSGRHVGVDVNSVDSRGNYVILPDASLVDAGVMSVTVSYDSAMTSLDVALVVGATGATYRLAAVVDLRSLLPEQVAVGFSAATGDMFASDHAVLSCSFHSTLATRNNNNNTSTSSSSKKATVLLHVGVTAAAVLVLLLGLTVGLLLRRASRRPPDNEKKDMLAGDEDDDSLDDDEFGSSTGPRSIPYAQLAASTEDFAEERKLGQGGSGSVYRGHMEELDDGRRDVAIKVFLRGASLEGRKEYRTEVTVISRLRHRNLVQLIGWCHGRRRLLLVYELVHHGSLDRYLYGSKQETLTWQLRYALLAWNSIELSLSIGLILHLFTTLTKWAKFLSRTYYRLENLCLTVLVYHHLFGSSVHFC